MKSLLKPNAGTKALLSYTTALHMKMISNRNIEDQEVEYIYGMAFVENMVDLRKRKDFTLYTPHPTQKLLVGAITDLEQLKATLTKR